MRLVMRPLNVWPTRVTVERIKPPFRADWSATKALLKREAKALNCEAREIIVELCVQPGDIRNDGELRAQFRTPSMPGVIVNVIDMHGKNLRLYADQYYHWLGNARAIALTLVALRAVNRYGIGTGHEAYVGFRELPPAPQPIGRTA
jgi:hypothetical protein